MTTKGNKKSDVTHLSSRLSELNDRILVLENDLQNTKKMVQQDMKRILKLAQEK